MNELTLGIDPSLSSTGWAFIELDSGCVVDFGYIPTSINPKDGEDVSTVRRSVIASNITTIYKRYERVNVAMETSIHGRNVGTTIALAGLSRVILDRFYLLGTPVDLFNNATVKATAKRVTGGTWKGLAKKEHMIAAAERRFGVATTVDDIADALWVAETARLLLLQHEADGEFD